MNNSQIAYLVFGVVLILAVIFDLGLLSKKETLVSIRKAIYQTVFWIGLAFTFFGFLWYQSGHKMALEYLSAYLMEWSLSIDNIFVFILIFNFFRVKEKYYGRVLLIGILMAILLRIVFITVGIALVSEFHWILYIFGAILVYTGISMFLAKNDGAMDLEDNRVYKFLKRFLPLTGEDGGGRYHIIKDGKKRYTTIFVVVVLLATTDIVFALDSIPAVFGITTEKLLIYSSNIFAVLGLRSLFFLIRGAVDKFSHLQQGIAVVLIFVGLKMLLEIFGIQLSVLISLTVILVCITSSVVWSMAVSRKKTYKVDRPK
jgi:tellurite resistance protein TerC